MEQTIAKLFNKKAPKTPDNFGLEFEMEGIDHRVRMPEGWDNEEDGSLRDNGREFVSNPPISYHEVPHRCELLRKALEDAGIKPRLSNLASTHIHVDVRDLNWRECMSLIALVMMFEKSLAKASGADRYNNYFALGNCEADANLRRLQNVSNEEQFKHFIEDFVGKDIRYSGINYDAINKYGSLEFRYLGMQVNPMDVLPWVDFYHKLKQEAKKDIDFHSLYQDFSKFGLLGLIKQFEPPFPMNEKDILDGIRCAQDITYRGHDDMGFAPNHEKNKLAMYFNNL